MQPRFVFLQLIVIAMLSPAALLGERRDETRTGRLQQGACLGIVVPASDGIQGDAAGVEQAAREQVITHLTDPSLKVVPLEARLRAPAMEEARRADCDRVLMMRLKHKTGGGVRGLTGRVAEGAGTWAAWSVPGSGVAGAAARGAAHAAAAAVGSLASATRAQDELRIDYEIVGTGDNSSASPQTERVKASADGEDLLTPLTRRVAERVHAALTAR
jgi:hypothetical protein